MAAVTFRGHLGFTIALDTQIISRVDNTQEILSVILGIAIVLLLTAGIAIKNIMYISILQRTREFAQLRTVGATYRQIKAVIHNERKQLSWKYILGGLLLGFLFNCVLPLKLYLVPSVACAAPCERHTLHCAAPYYKTSEKHIVCKTPCY